MSAAFMPVAGKIMDFLSCSILFAGVDAAWQAHLETLLQARGLRVKSVADGRSAFAGFDEDLPDLLVVPARLPDMPATQLCQRLRLNAATRGIPVVVVLPEANSRQESEILERGADCCFSMADNPLLLVFRICALLREYDEDLAGREGVVFRQPRIVIMTAPGGVLWAWSDRQKPADFEPARGGQPYLVELLQQNGEDALLVEDPEKLDLSGIAGSRACPDCVVVDLACPAFDGLALARTIAAFRRRSRQCTRIMGMVEHGGLSGEQVARAFHAGIDDLLDADTPVDLLVSRIGSLVRRKTLQDEARREEAHIESARARMALADALRRVNADLAAANRKLIEAQAKLVQSAKMASLGELAAGIAHEFNNPLAFVLAHENTVKRSMVKALHAVRSQDLVTAETALQKGSERLSASLIGLSRMRDLVASLRRFSRLEEGEFRRLDVPEAIGMVLTLLAPKLGQDIEVTCKLEAPPELVCQAALVNQVVMNIVSNAADAILDTRRETIQSPEPTLSRADRILITSFLEQAESGKGEEYVIQISDTGPGVPKELQERVFEPFFTTKPVGSGTGLGLATAYGVVQAHGGNVVVTNASTLGGACFTLRVPYRAGEERRGDNVA
ncbi:MULTISPECIES: ATP-binding protein [Acetobacter]|uniref:histidine kinase n=2 Tax=Acetobacter TaxID=434 RepID=A0AAN1PI02_9PROT|nr:MULTISPECIES: ATP-binding protein [Acetobacter]ASL39957.1 hybrid sensor histidine kinase/response regulator [Acetobacter oryzifermentans]AXN00611.1 hybrid sensor histidine kinase/response regulator [Acetobacter pomorum]KAA8397074.1 response regulator [Acetobacter sp. DmW_125128]KAA8397870.1 response regulator [Acetobacter sp. DmW_125124]KAA8399516.1 response regulator [Acetobacter sp. DmW_125127]